jgi:dTDP-4-amino-4,6-dideoxygalactose transaminase
MGGMRVPLLDLKPQFAAIEGDVRRQLDEVLASQHFVLGPKVRELEARLAEYCGARHAIGVSSGTDALLVALMALEVGPGDEVVTTPYSYFATAGCVARLGATPVFVDIDPSTMNLDCEKAAHAIGPRTRAVIPVHLFGRCAELAPLREAARTRGVAIVEDAAQALGAELDGRRAGSLGTIGCFSFFPSKNLGAFGDGGLVTTDDDALARKLRVLRVHGSEPKYFHKWIGGNFRLDALQAAVLLAKLPHLDDWTARRQANAERYRARFREHALSGEGGPVALPPPGVPGGRHVMNQFVIRAQSRDALKAFLLAREIETEIYYPLPLHLQECFAPLGLRAGAFPVAEACARDALSLPIYPELPAEAIDYVVGTVAEFYRG